MMKARSAFEVFFTGAAKGGFFDMSEDGLQRFIEVLVVFGAGAHVLEEFRGQDEKTLRVHHFPADAFRVTIRNQRVIEIGVSRFAFALIDEGGDVFRDETVKHRA